MMVAYIPFLVCFHLEASIIYRQGYSSKSQADIVMISKIVLTRGRNFYVIPSSIAFLATQLLHTT
jgi:hypothetical protein